MARSTHTYFTIIATAVVTAVLTSAVWLVIFNLAERGRPVMEEPKREIPEARQRVTPRVTAETTQVTVAGGPVTPADYAALTARQLTVPVVGVAAEALSNTYDDDRGGGERQHGALDIMAARGTPVVAVEDGRVEKLFQSVPGGLTIYQFDPSNRYAYYYAHLDRYADGLKEGAAVRRGEVIGYVGSTGNASPDGPHLHFAIFKLGPEKRWSEGTPINPYPLFTGRTASELAARQ